MSQNAEPIKLLFCADGIYPYAIGGMQRHSRVLIEELAKTNMVEIIAIHPHKRNVFEDKFKIKEIHVEGINAKKNYILECYRYSKRIYPILEQFPEHIIYSQGLSVWYKIKNVGSRLIINPHGLESYQSITLNDFILGLPFRVIFNYLFSNCAKVVSLGGKLTAILRRVVKEKGKIAVICNGINIPEDFSISERFDRRLNRLNLLFVGRFANNKGISILLKAVKKLNAEGYADKISYRLAGAGPLYESYVKNFQYKNVTYLGSVFDVQLFDLYKSADLFVLPTLYEGMPLVVLEAMSYALPVIVSDVGATSELVDGSNGYLIKRKDVTALKNAIIDFYGLNAEQKNYLSRNSHSKAKNYFSWGCVSAQYIALFRELRKQIK